jgi:hypothetical protein
VSGWDVAMFLILLWAAAGVLCVISFVVQIVADELHQHAKRRRQQEGQQEP